MTWEEDSGISKDGESLSASILIVEDSPTQAEWLRHLLEERGHRVTVAANGRAALAVLSRQKADVVVSDILMPEMDGYELCAKIKEDPGFKNIPVVLLTALSDAKDVIRALECGADNFVTKPFHEEALAARLRQLAAGREFSGNEPDSSGSWIVFAGQRHLITSDRRQIINLLLSTYEAAVQKNQDLARAQAELRGLNESLEEKITERTAALRAEIAQRRKAEEEIRRLAYYDRLTGLPNRTYLRERMERAILAAREDGTPQALLLMDLDRFKDINDTLGHQNGDLVLQEAGCRLADALPEADTVARLGGDEFAVWLPGAGEEAAVRTARRVLQALERPFVLEGLAVDVGASIGIALFPLHGGDADLIARRADVAMYAAKKAHGGCAVYDAAADDYSPQRLALVGELRRAISEGDLYLFYQPKIDLRTGAVLGVEALSRWEHPRFGSVPPDQFIALAERTGLIMPLTLGVVERALAQARAWRESGIDIKVAVNLSAQNLQAREFPQEMARLLQACGTPADRLELEITETAIMADPVRAMRSVTQLRTMGLRFAIDDFGTGYSSLAYLQRFPVDEVKIDKSFVLKMADDGNDSAIVRSIVDLGHHLGLKVVAEGVESREVMERLRSLQCDAAQGYYISRPTAAQGIVSWLKSLPRPLTFLPQERR